MINPILLALCWICFGAGCSKIAVRKNRSPSNWFMLGMAFGLIALAIIYFLKPLKSNQKKITVNPYLDVKNINDASIFQKDNNYWYYLDKAHKQVGPMSLRALFDNYIQGEISKASFVWNDTMKNWTKLYEVTHLSNLLKKDSTN
ncbi:MAG: Cell division protein DivIB [Candidatus Anoxychlamydiales bacterium]|nr:Cell division protein DivIB [Candidatus Anoxychlamydiales bacterium]NGX35252.1 Cell division protein DivIB [Candidatus Anoxychlamydiales bacterium]